MKKIFIILNLISVLLLFSTCHKKDEVPYKGTLKGTVSYTGSNNMEIDNVIITLRRNDTEEISERISKTGEYSFDLPAGEYIMDLKGNRCKSDELPYEVKINAGEPRTKAINIEQLPYSMVIRYKGNELSQEDTISLTGGASLDIWNKYSSNSLKWNIQAYPQPSWIIFDGEMSGTIKGNENGISSNSIVFSINENNMPHYGVNYADIILTTSTDNGSFSITVSAFKEGGEPEKATITGDNENICPAESVILAANAIDATSYKWYKGSAIINGANGNTYEVIQSGTYYVMGINAHGEGIKSDGKFVTLNTCPILPAKANISGSNANICPIENVILTANATDATSYKWYKGSAIINGANGNTYEVTQSDIYYVTGINAIGEGTKSNGKSVTINTCSIPPAKAAISGDSENICPVTKIILTASATDATSYKWYKGNSAINGVNGNTYEATQSGTYYVTGINAIGEGIKSDGKLVTINNCPSLPTKATISGNSSNDCTKDEQSVTLTANATGATSYIWRKGNEQLNETGSTLLIDETGNYTYYVKGVNISGSGTESTGKTVTILSCVPPDPASVDAEMSDKGIKLSWSAVSSATGYEIQICNSEKSECRTISPNVTMYSPSFDIEGSMLFCDMNHFKVTALNKFGQSEGKTISFNRVISITAPILFGSSGYLDWTSSKVKGTKATIYYDVYRKIKDGAWTKIEEKITSRSYSDSYNPKTVYYKIRAYITECEGVENWSAVEED
jgi:hypothetical protein